MRFRGDVPLSTQLNSTQLNLNSAITLLAILLRCVNNIIITKWLTVQIRTQLERFHSSETTFQSFITIQIQNSNSFILEKIKDKYKLKEWKIQEEIIHICSQFSK